MSALTDLDRMDLASLERAAFQRGDNLVAELAGRLIDAEGVGDVKPHLDEAYSQFPEDDFLSSITEELGELADKMRGPNKATLKAIIERLGELELSTARATEYGREELTKAIDAIDSLTN